ncbi:recombinase family protein [Enterococcus sp. AZ109]|uniref:recombinase family protein n=1 Tax=Enterococcus sp. AZ109 TaxID=2774634 RepID=UPI003F210229
MKTAIYVRVSTLEQAEEGYSIEEQIDKLSKYCEIKNWSISNIYRDGGYSGSNIERPAMKRLISDAKKEKFECVLVYKLDRLSRSQKDTLYLIEDVFANKGISFVSLNENFDTSTAFGKAMIGILAVFAQLEREQIKERMNMGKLGRAKSGKAMGWSRVPFGYFYEDDIYKIDPLQAPIVQQIFKEYLAGSSITKLIDKLNQEGHIGKDVKWSYRALRMILGNPIYAGYVSYQNQLFEGQHEPLISKADFETTKRELEVRQKAAYEKNNNPRPFQTKYMLSGLLKCGLCGAAFEVVLGNIRKDGTRLKTYSCLSRKSKNHNRLRQGNPNGCTSSRYRMEMLENLVLVELEKLRQNPKAIVSFSTERSISEEPGLITRLKEIDIALEKIVDLYLENTISKDVLDQRQKKLLDEKNVITNKLERIKSNQPDLDPRSAIETLSRIDIGISNLDYEKQKRLCKKLIDQVTVYPEKIEIKWKFKV